MTTIDEISLETVNKIGEVNCSRPKIQIKAQYQCLIIEAIEKAQAILSQGEPVAYRYKWDKDLEWHYAEYLSNREYYATEALFTAQPSTESLQKDVEL